MCSRFFAVKQGLDRGDPLTFKTVDTTVALEPICQNAIIDLL